jgi:mannosyltransferase
VRYGRVGIVALAIALALWFDPHEHQLRGKSNVYRVANLLKEQSLILPRDLVVSTHPEQGPLLRYYLGPDYRYADALGPVRDTQVFNWRNATDRLEAAAPRRTLDRLAPLVQPGQHLVLMMPLIRSASWGAPWTSLVRKRSVRWQYVLDHDPRFQFVDRVPTFKGRGVPRGMRAVVYLRR